MNVCVFVCDSIHIILNMAVVDPYSKSLSALSSLAMIKVDLSEGMADEYQ